MQARNGLRSGVDSASDSNIEKGSGSGSGSGSRILSAAEKALVSRNIGAETVKVIDR